MLQQGAMISMVSIATVTVYWQTVFTILLFRIHTYVLHMQNTEKQSPTHTHLSQSCDAFSHSQTVLKTSYLTTLPLPATETHTDTLA